MAAIPNNANINATIDMSIESATSLITGSTKAIDTVVKAIVKMTDSVSIKQLMVVPGKMKKIHKAMDHYIIMLNDLINILVNPNIQGNKQLSELCGYTKEVVGEKIINGKSTPETKEKYTQIDTLLKISSLVGDLFKGMNALSGNSMGVKAYINFRKNMFMMGTYLKTAIKDVVKVLKDVANDPDLQKIMDTLIGDPETITEIIESKEDSKDWDKLANSDKDSGKSVLKEDSKLTETKKGKQGFLDIVKGVFDVLKLIIEMQLPNPISFRIKMLRVKDCYKVTYENLKEISNLVTDDDAVKFQKLGELLRGTGKNGDDGLIGTTMNLYQVSNTLVQLGEGKILRKLKNVKKKFIPVFGGVLINIKDIFMGKNSQESIEQLISPACQKKIEKLIEVSNSINNVLSEIVPITIKLFLINTISKLIGKGKSINKISRVISELINGLNDSLIKIDKENLVNILEKLSSIKEIIGKLLLISLEIIALGMLSLIAVVMMIPINMFIKAFKKFINILSIILNKIEIIVDKKMNKGLKEVSMIILMLIYVELAVIIVGVLALPAAIATLIGSLFLLALWGFIKVLNIVLDVIANSFGKDAWKDLLKVVLIISMVLVIEMLMIFIGQYALAATKGLLLGLLFTILLIPFVLILLIGLLIIGIIVQSSLSIILFGLLGVIIILSLMMVAMLVLLVVVKIIEKVINVLERLKGRVLPVIPVFASLILFMTTLAAFGVSALVSAALATPGLIAALGLFILLYRLCKKIDKIIKLNLEKNIVIKGLKNIKAIINEVTEDMDQLITDRKQVRKARKSLRHILGLFRVLSRLAKIIKKFEKNSNLNKTLILNNIESVNSITMDIREKFGEYDVDGKQVRNSKRALRKIKKLVRHVYKLMNITNKLGKFKLNPKSILSNIDALFITISMIEDKLHKGSTDKESGIINPKLYSENGKERRLARREERRKAKASNKYLNRIDNVVDKIDNIVETLNEIQSIKLNPSIILSNLESMYKVVDDINEFIKSKNTLTPEEVTNMTAREIRKAARKQKRQAKAENKLTESQLAGLQKSEAVLMSIESIIDGFNSIKDFKIDSKTITGKVNTIFECLDILEKKMNEKSSSYTNISDFITDMLPAITELNNTMAAMSNIKENNSGKLLNHYINFIDKINTIKVENVEKTTAMFQQMARFSESINGNFEQLAEALNEKLLPVLVELKETMGLVPDKLDVGFANTSASIASNSQASLSTSDMTKQVQRENPNVSKEEVDKMVNDRLSKQAKEQTNSLGSKLDELIELLQGSGRIKVIPV